MTRTIISWAAALFVATPSGAGAQPFGRPLSAELKGRADIIYYEDFEAFWSLPQNSSVVSGGHQGKSLRIFVRANSHRGTDWSVDFRDLGMDEPEELYYRYYLRLGPNWDTPQNGKLPGFAGTYGRAGWGGRRATGSDGWSARGMFGNTSGDATRIGNYVYHTGMGQWGDHWWWGGDARLLKHGTWHCVEGYIKLNDPGSSNGVIRGWIDDDEKKESNAALEQTGIRFRDVDSLKVERFWFDVYHGGSWTAGHEMHLDADNLVIAFERVGCEGTGLSAGAGAPVAPSGLTAR